MPHIDEKFLSRLRENRQQEVQIIVQTKQDPRIYRQEIENLDLTIICFHDLMWAVTIEGLAKSILKLAMYHWVLQIDHNEKVSMRDESTEKSKSSPDRQLSVEGTEDENDNQNSLIAFLLGRFSS